MVPVRLPRSAGLCFLLAVVLALAAIALLPTGDAPALTGSTGPVNVTVTPTSGLTDGQAISIDATTSNGTISEIRAHICDPGISAKVNQFNFGFGGAFCTKVAPGAGDFETFVTLGNTTSGSLSFKAGTGTAMWTDEFLGDTHSLTCDSSHSCTLVVQFQSSVAPGLYYFLAPLTYAASGTTTTSSTTSTTIPSTTTSSTTTTSTTTPSTTTSTTSTSTTSTTIPSTTTSSTTSTTTPATTTSSTTTTKPPATTTSTTSTTTTTKPPATTTSTTSTTLPATTTTTTPSGDGTVSPSQVTPGGSFTVSSSGWQTGTTVDATFHSDPVALGQLTAGSDGSVSGSFNVPAGAAVGSHTVELVGTGSDGGSKTASIVITVTSTAPVTPTSVPASVSATGASNGTTPTLPFTGASSKDLASISLLLVGTGLLLLSFRRRHLAEP